MDFQSDQTLRLFVSSVQDYAIFMLDLDGRITSWNAGAQRIKGYTEEEAVGQHFSLFYTEPDREQRRPDRELRIAAHEGRYEEEGWRVRKDGTRFWASVTITAVRHASGRPIGFGKVTRDLTERKQVEQVLRHAKHAAEAASQAKSEFLTAMSHELRTPLNAIIGYAELLHAGIAGGLSPEQKRHLKRIRAASGHLLLQVDQILSLSRIEAGTEEVQLEVVAAKELAQAAIELVAPQAERKGLEARLDAPAEGVQLRTDPTKVRQILLNLLSNAVNYTDAGAVGLRLDRESVRFQVWDTGVGIADEDRERIFEHFTQADQSSTRQQDGAGLGLSISRKLARLLGGELVLESTTERGSTFSLDLPIESRPARSAAERVST